MQGKFFAGRMEIQLPEGRYVSGTEFERMAGRGAAKKWKVRKGDVLTSCFVLLGCWQWLISLPTGAVCERVLTKAVYERVLTKAVYERVLKMGGQKKKD